MNTLPPKLRGIDWRSGFVIAASLLAPPLCAHPHVFVDGGVDFVFDDKNKLAALEITWLYDEFETLYILSSYELSLTSEGDLSESDRQELVKQRSNWPEDFDGSAHLSVDGEQVELEWPKDLDAWLINGRLQLTFKRNLAVAVDIEELSTEVAFYESSYFFDFSITKTPQLFNAPKQCNADVVPFFPDPEDKELQSALAKLSREETPDNAQVGAFFADRIKLECV